MEKILEYIICDKYTNKDLDKNPNVEYYLIKFSQKDLVIFSDKTYRFEYFADKKQIIKLDFLLEMIGYRLENLSDCKTTMNKFNKSILVEYNENNTFLIVNIVNDVIEEYFKCIDLKYEGVNLSKLFNVSCYEDNNNIIINEREKELFRMNVDMIKEDLFKCYYVEGIGNICGKIIFDNVFNHSRCLKNKINVYNLEEYKNGLVNQESLKKRYEKNYSYPVANRFKK